VASRTARTFQAMVLEKPYLFIHEDLFAAIVAPKPKKCDLPCDKVDPAKLSDDELGCYLFECLDFLSIKKSCIDTVYKQAKEDYQKSTVMQQGDFLNDSKKYLKLFDNELNAKLDSKISRFDAGLQIRLKLKAAALAKSGNSSVSNWRQENWGKEISSGKRLAIALWFGYDMTVWEIQSTDIMVIKSELAKHRTKDIFRALDFELDPHQRRDCMETKKLREYIEQKRYKEAMAALETLLATSDPCKYRNYNWLLHQKAVLFSTDEFKKWDEALDLLQTLFYASDYVLEEPEIITLIASNYKRKALHDKEGNRIDHKTLSDSEKKRVLFLLLRSMEFYKHSYDLKSEKSNKTNALTDAFYDAVNIAYLKKIIEAIEGKPFEIDLAPYNITGLNANNWWEGISSIEWKYLTECTDSNDQEKLQKINNDTHLIYEMVCSDPTPDQLAVVLRQIDLFLHFVKEDCSVALFKELKGELTRKLSEVNMPS